jgi:hypothetical protein
LQPHLVITGIARCDHVTRRSFVAGHCDVLFARFARMRDCSICSVVGVSRHLSSTQTAADRVG